MSTETSAPPSPAPAEGATVEACPSTGGGLFSYGGFVKLFFASLAGKFGDRLYQMAMLTAAILIFAKDASENQLAWIQIVATLPLPIAYPLCATLVDIADRRRLMGALMLIKGVIVVGLVPVLWAVHSGSTPEEFAKVREYWPFALGLIFVISIFDAPFGPARAAAVPDVSPVEHRGLAASLMASSGLISILLGTLVGGQLAATSGSIGIGPGLTIFVAIGFYLLSTLLLSRLPDIVAVPGEARHPGEGSEAIKKGGVGAYFADLWVGLKYSLQTRGVWELIAFETLFWCLGSAFYVVFTYLMRVDMHLRAADIADQLSLALGLLGIGMIAGAAIAGKISKHLTPMLTYPFAFLVMGLGATLLFSTKAIETKYTAAERIAAAATTTEKGAKPAKKLEYLDWVSVTDPDGTQWIGQVNADKGGDLDSLTTVPVKYGMDAFEKPAPVFQVAPANLVLIISAVPGILLFYAFLLGLGGGLVLGRVDADVLQIVPEEMRGRIFSIKGMGFTIALLGTLVPLSFGDNEWLKRGITDYLGIFLLVFILPALVMSLFIDVGMYATKEEVEKPTKLHDLGYRFWQFFFWCWLKFFFRFEVKNEEKIPMTGPVLLACNHASFLDPLFVSCIITRPVQWIMYRSYYRSLAHPWFRLMRAIPVDEKNHLAALKTSVRSLEQGICIGIFPEGTVTHDGNLSPPQGGALFLAQKSGAPVIPVAIKGNWEAFPRTAWFPRFKKVIVLVGDPFVVPKNATKKQVAELVDGLMADLAGKLGIQPPEKTADKIKERGKEEKPS